MADFDNNPINPRAGKPLGAAVWSLAAVSVAAFLCSVLTAKMLARMVDQSDAPVAVFTHDEQSMRELAAAAPSSQPPQKVTIFRSVGVDGMTTATIPGAQKATLQPCGDQKQR